MKGFNKMLDLLAFLNELPSIAQRADTERLSVMLPEFKAEFPQLWEEILYCSTMESPSLVIAFLCERNPALVFLKKVPNVEPTIQFLMDFVKESERNENNPITGTGELWTDGRYRSRERPALRRTARRPASGS